MDCDIMPKKALSDKVNQLFTAFCPIFSTQKPQNRGFILLRAELYDVVNGILNLTNFEDYTTIGLSER